VMRGARTARAVAVVPGRSTFFPGALAGPAFPGLKHDTSKTYVSVFTLLETRLGECWRDLHGNNHELC